MKNTVGVGNGVQAKQEEVKNPLSNLHIIFSSNANELINEIKSKEIKDYNSFIKENLRVYLDPPKP